MTFGNLRKFWLKVLTLHKRSLIKPKFVPLKRQTYHLASVLNGMAFSLNRSVLVIEFISCVLQYLRNPGSDWQRRLREQKMKRNASRGLSGPDLEIILKEENKKGRDEFRDRYLAKTAPKMMQGYVQVLAKLGMKAVERDLKRRQEA